METNNGSSSSPGEESCSFKDEGQINSSLEIKENIFGFEVIDIDGWLFLKSSIEESKKDNRLAHIADVVSFAEHLAQSLEKRGLKDTIAEDTLSKILTEITTDLTDDRTVGRAILVLKCHWRYGEQLYTAYLNLHN